MSVMQKINVCKFHFKIGPVYSINIAHYMLKICCVSFSMKQSCSIFKSAKLCEIHECIQ